MTEALIDTNLMGNKGAAMQRERPKRHSRRGSMLVLSALMSSVMCVLVALAVDVGFLLEVRSQLQRSADSAALAGAALLVDENRLKNGASDNLLPPDQKAIRNEARRFARLNDAGSEEVILADNASNSVNGEIVVGTFTNPSDQNESLSTADPKKYNTVFVRKEIEVPVFFARVFGWSLVDVSVRSAATAWPGVSGFRAPPDGTLQMLPITLKTSSWNKLLREGQGNDEVGWEEETQTIYDGGDGIREWDLYPNDTTSGNFGTIDLGSANNSTQDLKRQILHGLNANDLKAMGGEIKLLPDGHLDVQGDTGISAGIKGSLEAIIGQKRIIPLYDTVKGVGNNTYYKIVGFAGIRIVGVRLTGAKKAVIIQPATISSAYSIVDPGLSLPDNLVYTTPRLTR